MNLAENRSERSHAHGRRQLSLWERRPSWGLHFLERSPFRIVTFS